jgi:hypothetical protein
LLLGAFVGVTTDSTLLEKLETNIVEIAHAQTATSSSETEDSEDEQSEEDISETTRNLRERIERIVDEKRDQIKGVLTEIDSKRRSTIGEIQRVTEDTLSIRSQTGTEIIPISNTQYPLTILKDGEPIEFDEIAVGNWLLAFGVIEEDSFQPIRLLISDDSLRPRTRTVSIGTITDIARTSIEIEPRSGEGTVTYTISADTEYQDLSGEVIGLNDIDESMQAIVAGIVTETDDDDESSTRAALKIRLLTTIETQ